MVIIQIHKFEVCLFNKLLGFIIFYVLIKCTKAKNQYASNINAHILNETFFVIICRVIH